MKSLLTITSLLLLAGCAKFRAPTEALTKLPAPKANYELLIDCGTPITAILLPPGVYALSAPRTGIVTVYLNQQLMPRGNSGFVVPDGHIYILKAYFSTLPTECPHVEGVFVEGKPL